MFDCVEINWKACSKHLDGCWHNSRGVVLLREKFNGPSHKHILAQCTLDYDQMGKFPQCIQSGLSKSWSNNQINISDIITQFNKTFIVCQGCIYWYRERTENSGTQGETLRVWNFPVAVENLNHVRWFEIT